MLFSLKKNHICAIFLLVLGVAASLIGYCFYSHTDSYCFHEYTTALFADQLRSDTLSMHYTVSNPADYHINHYQVTLPDYQEASYVSQSVFLENQLHILRSIHPEGLSDRDALTHELLLHYMKQQQLGCCYPYYSEPLSPGSGIASQLPILLAEYYFEDERDVQEYLSLLSCIPSYFSSLEEYEKTRSQMGLFMPSFSSRKIVEQCQTIVASDKVKDHTHFLITTFLERIQKLQAASILNSSQVQNYTRQNEEILMQYVIPAYDKLGATIAHLQSSSENENGLCYFPKGRDYYAYLVKQVTGSSKSIPAIKILLQEQLRENYIQLSQLYDFLKTKDDKTLITFPYNDPNLMMQDLKQRSAEDFPPLSSSEQLSPNCTIKTVSPSLADYVSPAFYLTPPIDLMEENSIYINEKSILDDLELYTTLAHEGYPGHLYQTISFQQLNHPDPVRQLLFYGGYTEGWALYTENYAYEYAKNLLKESQSDYTNVTEALLDLYRCNRNLQLCMYSILDIGTHYDGLQYEEVHSMLAEFGITDDATTTAIYQYIVEEPSNYLKYYLGYLEFLETKDYYKKLSGTSYRETDFHQKVLELGPMDFDTLRRYLKDSISIESEDVLDK